MKKVKLEIGLYYTGIVTIILSCFISMIGISITILNHGSLTNILVKVEAYVFSISLIVCLLGFDLSMDDIRESKKCKLLSVTALTCAFVMLIGIAIAYI